MEMRLPDRGGIEPGKNGGFFPGLKGQPTPQPCPLLCCPLKAHPAQEHRGHPGKGGLSSPVPSSAGPRSSAWVIPWSWLHLLDKHLSAVGGTHVIIITATCCAVSTHSNNGLAAEWCFDHMPWVRCREDKYTEEAEKPEIVSQSCSTNNSLGRTRHATQGHQGKHQAGQEAGETEDVDQRLYCAFHK